MAYLCCPVCWIRLPGDSVAIRACPECDRPLELLSAGAALGYRLFEIVDPVPLSPTAAAVAVALSALRPGSSP